MQPTDPFPIERCSLRLQKAILAEFNGRSPTYQDILSIPAEEWMRMPGIGPALLREMQNITHSHPVVPPGVPSPKPDDADLIARLERFQRDLEQLQRDIQMLLGEAPSGKADANGSDLH
jgi:hypothetical protein